MDIFSPISASDVPFYSILKDLVWVDGFLKGQDLRRKIQLLMEERRKLKKMPLATNDVLEALKEHYKTYKARRIKDICIRISQGGRTGDPFKYLDERMLQPLVLWDEIEAALEQVDDDGTITENARSEKLEEIEKTLADLQIALAEVSPSRYFLLDSGQVIQDARQVFVYHWRRIQGRVNAACGPQGIMLDRSTEAEIMAYKKLEIAKSINTKTRQAPHPGQKLL